jgi:hypothetical protein
MKICYPDIDLDELIMELLRIFPEKLGIDYYLACVRLQAILCFDSASDVLLL